MAPIQPSLVSSPTDSPTRTCAWATDFRGDTPHPGKPPVTSLYNLFQRSATSYPNNPCLGWRHQHTYAWWTYQTVSDHIDALRAALAQAGVNKGDRVALYARNSPQWTLLQYAILSSGAVIVPVYDTLGPNTLQYACQHAGCVMVFVSVANYPKLEAVRSKSALPTVQNVVIMGDADIVEDSQAAKLAADADKPTTTMHAFLQSGQAANPLPPADLCLDDLLVVMYTSGTTGNPKGVMLKHRALVASVSSAYAFFNKWGTTFNPDDSFLSYLPLSHIFEQQAEALFIGCGARIGFFSGDIKLLLSDMEALRPTHFAGVPRVFARFQQRIEENVESAFFLQKMLFHMAYNRQLRAEQHPDEVSRSPIWDALVIRKIRAKLLPEVRLVITGSAPMSAQTNDFLKVCLNCPVVQGYGLTETVGGMVCSVPGRSKSGTCGGPLPGVEVKLRDLPEMGYTTTDKPYPRGEVCVKGDIVFSGYFENDQATTESFDEDGFFRTGDVGQWLDDGALQIIDRAKNLFKLAQGEYVSPEALEQEYGKAKLVGQIYVYGNSLQATLLAVVVPDVPAAKAWGRAHGGLTAIEEIVKADGFKTELLKQLEEMRVKSSFKKYETIKDVVLEASGLNELGQGFTVDNNLMTPSFKLKRPQLKEKYVAALDALYDKLNGGKKM